MNYEAKNNIGTEHDLKETYWRLVLAILHLQFTSQDLSEQFGSIKLSYSIELVFEPDTIQHNQQEYGNLWSMGTFGMFGLITSILELCSSSSKNWFLSPTQPTGVWKLGMFGLIPSILELCSSSSKNWFLSPTQPAGVWELGMLDSSLAF
ncbi:hypothetical protein BgiBS90_012787 [Biomphalaria glabrata]|nr:hypothetical protein BgiBS90_012787 [Biomphalaria glabrata]